MFPMSIKPQFYSCGGPLNKLGASLLLLLSPFKDHKIEPSYPFYNHLLNGSTPDVHFLTLLLLYLSSPSPRRLLKGCRFHSLRPAQRGRAGDSGAEWHDSQERHRANCGKVREQPEQQQDYVPSHSELPALAAAAIASETLR